MYNVKVYDKKAEGNAKLSANFRAKEFACNDGSNVIFISTELIAVLQNLREHFGKCVYINSGYRTISYNTMIENSSSNSAHCKGIAADIYITGVNPKQIYEYLNNLYPNKYGIGLYNSFVHIDVRHNKARW